MRITAFLIICFSLLNVSLGCRKEDWIPPEKKPSYRAEVTALPSGEGLHFKKLNDGPWSNVVFTLNKEYIFSVTEVPAGQHEFIIDYEGFRHKDTGLPYDPTAEEVWRIWIEWDEGYWY